MKLTFEKIKKAMEKGEVILEDTKGLLRKVLIFATNDLTIVTEVVSEESLSNGSVYTWNEADIAEWTIKPHTKKYWLWAYTEAKHVPLYVTNKFYDEEYKDSKGNYFTALANSVFKTKLLNTEIELYGEETKK